MGKYKKVSENISCLNCGCDLDIILVSKKIIIFEQYAEKLIAISSYDGSVICYDKYSEYFDEYLDEFCSFEEFMRESTDNNMKKDMKKFVDEFSSELEQRDFEDIVIYFNFYTYVNNKYKKKLSFEIDKIDKIDKIYERPVKASDKDNIYVINLSNNISIVNETTGYEDIFKIYKSDEKIEEANCNKYTMSTGIHGDGGTYYHILGNGSILIYNTGDAQSVVRIEINNII